MDTDMEYDEFLDNEKKRGIIVYKCLNCDFRGMGAPVTYHGLYHPDHTIINEDKENVTNKRTMDNNVRLS